MNMEILVSIKNVYGKELYYPANFLGQVICECAQSKTLTPHMIDRLKMHGFSIKAVSEAVEL